MLHRRTVLLALAFVALAAALLPATAAIGAKPHATRVIVSLKLPAFHGKLTSADDGCLGGRRVALFRKKGSRPAKKLGSDTSSANGAWSVPIGKKIPAGNYFATVAAKGECLGGKSKALNVPG
ncbi:MAG TPA: hypothetical protein VMT37_13890 [Solirubrobacterales bacterium]|nr:hypothetical protein [Solirubrobacterales bacterium]